LTVIAWNIHAARWTVANAVGEPVSEADVRRLDGNYYIALDDLDNILDGKMVPATVRYRYVAPTKTLTLQLRVADDVMSLRMSAGSQTVRASGGRGFTLRSDLKEVDDAVWVPLQILTDVLPTITETSISFTADSRRITVGRSAGPANAAESTSHEPTSLRERPSGAAVTTPGETPYLPTPVSAPVWSELVVALNAGHGGADTGARANGLVEKAIALDVVQRVQRLAETVGAKTILVRRGDYALAASSRAAAARDQGANLFLSVHFNAAFQTNLKGYRIYVNYPTPASVAPARGGRVAAQWAHVEASRKLASLLDSALSAAGFEGERPTDLPLAELERMRMPSVLVELGFLTNPSDAAMWMKSETLDRAAEAIWGALAQFQP
jgi:N-acetylmuramoyl-L-alanine amidase